MRKQLLLLSSLVLTLPLSASSVVPAYEIVGNDTTCNIFLYSPGANDGLHVAYLTDKEQWHDMGQLCGSEYDRQGSGKMFAPYVYHAADGSWRLLFGVGGKAPCFAAAYSEDLVTWRPQDFPKMKEAGITAPVLFEMDDSTFDIYCKANDGSRRYVKANKDFRHFVEDSVASSISDDAWIMDTATVAGHCYDGNMFEVPKVHLDYIMHYFAALANENRLSDESMKDDTTRCKDFGENVSVTLSVDPAKTKRITEKLSGLDIEDINRKAKGGLYAELLKDVNDIPHNDKTKGQMFITKQDTLFNNGWDGIRGKIGQQFDFSVDLRVTDGKKSQAFVALIDDNGEEFAKEKIKLEGNGWQHFALPLTIEENKKDKEGGKEQNLRLALASLKDDSIEVRSMSLFPHETFKGHRMKLDLGEEIASLHPGFIRIPGNIEAISKGASLYDYFMFCKDIDAEPVLDFTSDASADAMLRELADANNDTMPIKPKYVVIGAGSRVNTDYEEHFLALAKAIKERYPDIAIISSTGSTHDPSSDYAEGWKFAKANNRFVSVVSEQYDATPGWLVNHQDYYDSYDRNDAKVYLSEWASKGNTVEDALAEALYICSLERNGDVVEMSGYPSHALTGNTPSHYIQELLRTHSGSVYIPSKLQLAQISSPDNNDANLRLGASIVKNAAGKTFVKLVNALPANAAISISGLQINDGVTAEGFSGNPNDKTVKPVKTTVSGQKITLPPYSVVVISL